jgi:hypothetical protein
MVSKGTQMKLLLIIAVILSPLLAQFTAEQIPATPLFFIAAFVLFGLAVRFVMREATS